MTEPANKYYQCQDPECGYTNQKTFLVTFEENELRFCAKCYLKFLQGLRQDVPFAIELPARDPNIDPDA